MPSKAPSKTRFLFWKFAKYFLLLGAAEAVFVVLGFIGPAKGLSEVNWVACGDQAAMAALRAVLAAVFGVIGNLGKAKALGGKIAGAACVLLAAGLFALQGCAPGNLAIPLLPGPADEVHCQIDRTAGAREGTYECHVKGRYELRGLNL